KQAIQQTRLADVGPPDERDLGRTVAIRPCSRPGRPDELREFDPHGRLTGLPWRVPPGRTTNRIENLATVSGTGLGYPPRTPDPDGTGPGVDQRRIGTQWASGPGPGGGPEEVDCNSPPVGG